MRPRPRRGAGLAQGGQPNLMKQVFSRAIFFHDFTTTRNPFFFCRQGFPAQKNALKTRGRTCYEYLRSFLLVKDEGYFTV